MIVCVCKVVSDREIKAAIERGSQTFADLQIDLGVCLQCQTCEQCVRQLLDEQTVK